MENAQIFWESSPHRPRSIADSFCQSLEWGEGRVEVERGFRDSPLMYLEIK